MMNALLRGVQNKQPHPVSVVSGFKIPGKCSCGNSPKLSGQCDECERKTLVGIQPKLQVGAVNDAYEQEADKVADQVMAASVDINIGSSLPQIQRYSAQPSSQMSSVPATVKQVLASPGVPMQLTLRHNMEQQFGRDFSQVRLHLDGEADRSAKHMRAHAYTSGNNIVFGSDQFAPDTQKGRQLLAHELTHVVQQNNSELNDHVLQKKGGTFGGFFRNIGRAITDFFTGSEPSYENDVLRDYLSLLKKTKDIEGDFDSDNKARAVVVRQSMFKPHLADTQIKVLLTEEMLSGPTLGDDEKAIIGLLRTSTRDESSKIVEKIGRKRLWDNFSGKNRRAIEAITLIESDLNVNSVVERLKGLSTEKLTEYKDNARDPAVRASIVKILHMQKITTPLDLNVNFDKTGMATFELSGAIINVMPDVASNDPAMGRGAYTEIATKAGDIANVMATTDGSTITSFTGGKTTFTIQTTYGPEAVLTGPSKYGRGTTTPDKASGKTSLKFHESQHGIDILKFITDNPPPRFRGKVGGTVKQFDKAMDDYGKETTDYSTRIKEFTIKKTDCPGAPIESSRLQGMGLSATFCTDPAKP